MALSVGGKVTCLNNKSEDMYLTIGKVYVIDDMIIQAGIIRFVSILDDQGKRVWASATRFMKIASFELTTALIVAILSSKL